MEGTAWPVQTGQLVPFVPQTQLMNKIPLAVLACLKALQALELFC